MTQTEETAARQLRLRSQHVSFGARFAPFSGWEMPLWYAGAVQEHMAVRESAGVFDISHMGRLRIDGPESAAMLASLFTRDPGTLEIGATAYGFACNDAGGIIDDLIIYRLDLATFLVICNAGNASRIEAIIDAALPARAAKMVDLREQETVLLAVQGPTAVSLVTSTLGANEFAIDRRRCASISAAGEDYFLARTGYTGEDGFEILTSAAAGAKLLENLFEVGCQPCGLAARDSLRLEAALALHGHDIDESTTPWQAGLGWAVELDHEFHGRDALIQSKEKTEMRLACIVAENSGVIRAGFKVMSDSREVGTISSGGFSPMLETSIALAYLPRPLAKAGVSLEVDVRGRSLACHTVKRPFYAHSSDSKTN